MMDTTRVTMRPMRRSAMMDTKDQTVRTGILMDKMIQNVRRMVRVRTVEPAGIRPVVV